MLSTTIYEKTENHLDFTIQKNQPTKKIKPRKKDLIWQSIFNHKNLHSHNFNKQGISLNSDEIRELTLDFSGSAKEPRILCRHINPKEQPAIFNEKGIFCMPVKNKEYLLIKGNPFTSVPKITTRPINLQSPLFFNTVCSHIGDSEMQHLDYCFNSGVLHHFLNTNKRIVQTMRGRKYCRSFDFFVGQQKVSVEGVQYETDAVYETEDEIIICEAKNSNVDFIHNRQFFYPFKDISLYANNKPIRLVLFCHKKEEYSLWEYRITNPRDFNSLAFLKSEKYVINNSNTHLLS